MRYWEETKAALSSPDYLPPWELYQSLDLAETTRGRWIPNTSGGAGTDQTSASSEGSDIREAKLVTALRAADQAAEAGNQGAHDDAVAIADGIRALRTLQTSALREAQRRKLGRELRDVAVLMLAPVVGTLLLGAMVFWVARGFIRR